MKKILIVVLCALLLCVILAGCTTEPIKEEIASTAEAITTSREPSAEPTITLFSLDSEERMKGYAYKTSSLWRKKEEVNNIWYYKTDNNADGGLQVVYTVTEEVDTADESIVIPRIDDTISGVAAKTGVSNMSSSDLVTIGGSPAKKFNCNWEMNSINYLAEGVVIIDKTGICSFLALEPENSDRSLISTFPEVVDSIAMYEAKDDFLKDEEMRSQVTSLMNNFQFVDIVTLADSYIAEQSPVNTDSVYEIKQYAEQANAAMTNCSIVTDDFENKSTLFGTVDAISADINFVPFIDNEVKTFDLKAKVGFKQNGWLFMDNVSIKVDEDDYLTEFFSDPTRDIISGGTILEEDIMELKYEEADKIINAEAPIMRFEGEDGKTRDHDMTSAEVESLKSISIVSQSIDGISAIIKQWTEENIY